MLSAYPFKTAQRGLVLFVALIALVVMSLASVALIRSVDTSSLVTGNLAFKQSAAISSSFGIEALADTIGSQPTDYAYSNSAGNGYYATCDTFDSGGTGICNGNDLVADARWTNAASRLATGEGISDGKDAYGNTIRYIVERMCRVTGAPGSDRCLMAHERESGGAGCADPCPTRPPGMSAIAYPIYRITVRIAGPKNTITYVQALVS